MKNFKPGTPVFGVFLGMVFLLCGGLIMWLGIWRTLVLVVLFAAGYFLGAIKDKTGAVKAAVDKVVPEKKESPIDFRKEVEKEQKAKLSQASESPSSEANSQRFEEQKNEDRE